MMSSTTHLRIILTVLSTPLGVALTATAGPLPPRGVLGPPPHVDGLAVGSQFLSMSRECALTGERVDFKVIRRASRPACFQIGGLVSQAECDHLIAAADAIGMEKALTAGGERTDDGRRSCRVAWLPVGSDAVAASLCGALEQLFLQPEVLEQTDWASGGCWENMQCLLYSPGGEFLPHYDANERMHRILTVLLYLNGEGETWFPLAQQDSRDAQALANTNSHQQATLAAAVNGQLDASHEGLLLRPRKGDAVAFYNLLDNGSRQIDHLSLHAGLPASVEKRVATLWYHLNLHSDGTQPLPLGGGSVS